MDTTYYSSYYERMFSRPEMINAFSLYLNYMKRIGMPPDVKTLEEMYEYEVGETVLYHAEIEQQHQYGRLVNFSSEVALPVQHPLS